MSKIVNCCDRKHALDSLVFIFLLFIQASMLHAGEVSADIDDDKINELTILNWSEYLDPELVAKFEKQYQAKIMEIYFESDDHRDNYMLETQGKGIDIVVINGIVARQYINQKWITPFSDKEVPNLKHIDKKWIGMFEGTEGYTLPYFWGTIGIAYRKDLMKQSINSWHDLFQPDELVSGKIAMVPANRDLIGMALKALGYSANSTSFDELKAARNLLLQQKPHVKEYLHIALGAESSMTKGDILMAMTYSGDALMLMDADENIAYVVPEEGTNLWVDYMAVTQGSSNKALSYKFLNFINEPDHAAQMAEYVYYATPNKAAEKLLPEDFKSDTTIYPPKEILDRSEVYTRMPPRVTRYRNEIFVQVTE